MNICLKDLGIVCAIGTSKQTVMQKLQHHIGETLTLDQHLSFDKPQYVGRVTIPDRAEVIAIKNRNNQLAFLAYEQIAATLEPLIKQYGKHRYRKYRPRHLRICAS